MVTALPKFAGVLPGLAREDLCVDTDLINRVEPFVANDEDDAMLLDTIIEKLMAGDSQPFLAAVGNFAEFNISSESLD